MIESKHENPCVVSQTTQAELAEQLIDDIEAAGGRFLEWDNRGYWTEIRDRLRIYTKVALSIRDFKYKTKARKNVQANRSYTYLFQGQDGNKRKRMCLKSIERACDSMNETRMRHERMNETRANE
eukprot:jgi/Psemu1/316822/fgenesh1_kg.4241_\